MIGQGALGRPWIFTQVAAYLERGQLLPDPPLERRLEIMLEQFSLACSFKGEGQAMREARKHAGWYLKGMRGAAAFRRQAGQLCTLEDAKALRAGQLPGEKHPAMPCSTYQGRWTTFYYAE